MISPPVSDVSLSVTVTVTVPGDWPGPRAGPPLHPGRRRGEAAVRPLALALTSD